MKVRKRKLTFWDLVFAFGLSLVIVPMPLVFLANKVESISIRLLVLRQAWSMISIGLVLVLLARGFERMEKKFEKMKG